MSSGSPAMPIKWRLVLLSASLLLVILLLFHVFVYKLFENMIVQTEQSVLERKLASLSEIYKGGEVRSVFLERELQVFTDEGQAIRIVKNGRVVAQVNKGVSPALFLSGKDSRKSVKEVRDFRGKQVSLLAAPMDGVKDGRIELYTDFTSLQRYLDTMLQALMSGSSVLLVTVVVGGYVMSSIALNPVRRISQTVKELDPARLESRLHVPATRDEIEVLSRTFNQLLDRIYDMIQRQRQFVADASHELRTPVSVIRGYTNLLRRWGKKDPQVTEEALKAIDQETDRMERMTAHLLSLARLENEQPAKVTEPVNLTELTAEQVNRWKGVLKQHRLLVAAKEPLHGWVSRGDWEELLDILLDNAGKYAPSGSIITVSLHRDGEEIVLKVRDTGEGIPKEEMPHVFERFYRAKPIRGRKRPGSGLGLAIARRIVETWGGRISIDSRVGEWTEVVVRFPFSQ